MKKLAVIATGAGLLACSEVMAAGMYFEADYMKLDMTWKAPSGLSGSYDASPSAIGIKLGSQINPYFAVEGMIGFGIADDEFLNESGVSATGELNSIVGVNALGTIPVADNFKIYGKLGFAKVDVDLGFNAFGVSQSYSSDDTGALFGAGLMVNFTENSALALEYIQLPDVDVEILGTEFGTIETTSINFGYRASF